MPRNIPRPRRARPLVAAVAILIIIGVAATGWITIREFQVQRSVFASILNRNSKPPRPSSGVFLDPLWQPPGHPGTVAGRGPCWTRRSRRLKSLLIPLVDPTDQVAAVYIIPETGPMFTQVRTLDGWVAGRPDSTGQGAGTRNGTRRAPAAGIPGLIHWSNYGPLPGDGRPGLVAARSVGGTVLALGLLKKDLDRFAATAPITENGILVRRYDQGRSSGCPPRAATSSISPTAASCSFPASPEHAVIGAALIEWGRLGPALPDLLPLPPGRPNPGGAPSIPPRTAPTPANSASSPRPAT